MSDSPRKAEQVLTDEVSRAFKQQAELLIINLYKVLRISRFHSIKNAAAQQAMDRVADVIQEIFRINNRVSIFYSGKDFYVNEARIKTTASTFEVFDGLTKDFEERNIGKLDCYICPPREELEKFAIAFNDVHPKKVEHPFKALTAVLKEQNVKSIVLSEYTGKAWDDLPRIDKKTFVKQSYFRGIQVARQLYRDAKDGKPIRLKSTKRVVQNYVDALSQDDQGHSDLLLLLTDIKNWQGYLFNHAVNTCVLSLGFALALGIKREALRDLGISAMTIDIGNALIDPDILDHPGPLTDAQWAIVQTHPTQAVNILANTQEMDTALIRAVMASLTHHRHFDGSGYPTIKYDKHYIFSEIIGICDGYDAMTTSRPYRRKTLTPPQAIKELASMAGTAFNPLLVKAFVHWMGEVPVGTIVVLEDNTLGIVVSRASRVGGDSRPKIKVLDQDVSQDAKEHNFSGALAEVPSSVQSAKTHLIVGDLGSSS